MIDGGDTGARAGKEEGARGPRTPRPAAAAPATHAVAPPPPPPPPPPPRLPPPPPYWPPPPGHYPTTRGIDPAPATAVDVEIQDHAVPLDRQLAAGFAPRTRRDAWVWLIFAALGFLAGQIIASIFVLISAAITGNSHNISAVSRLNVPPEWYVVSTLLGIWIGFFGGPWLASRVRGTRRLVRDLGLRFRWIDLVGVPIGVAGQYLVAAMYIPLESHIHNFNQRFSAPGQKLTGASHGAGFAVIAIFTVVGAPLFEELFFRGLILRALSRLFGAFARWVGPALAIVITGVLFGLAHAESLQLLGLATFGIILSFIAYRTGRLGMNIFAHASFNLVAIIAVLATGSGVIS